MQTVTVIDFETTGLSPAMGDRATEVAVVMVADGKIVNLDKLKNRCCTMPSAARFRSTP